MEFKISMLQLYPDFFEFVQRHQKNPLSRNRTSDLRISFEKQLQSSALPIELSAVSPAHEAISVVYIKIKNYTHINEERFE